MFIYSELSLLREGTGVHLRRSGIFMASDDDSSTKTDKIGCLEVLFERSVRLKGTSLIHDVL